MSRHRILGCALGLFAIPAAVSALEPDEVFAKVSASIVSVGVDRGPVAGVMMGSGVIVSPGEIVTSCSIVRGADLIAVARDTAKAVATLRFEDANRDLCQLTVGTGVGFDTAIPVTADVADVRVGQKVFAIGAPHGPELTLTDGLVASVKEVEAGLDMQTTAMTWEGSDGGGLFNADGALIGITKFDSANDQNLFPAISANWVSELPSRTVDFIKAEQLRALKEQRCLDAEQRRRVEKIWSDSESEPVDSECESVLYEVRLKRLEQWRRDDQMHLEEAQRIVEHKRLRHERYLTEKNRQEELARLEQIEREREANERAAAAAKAKQQALGDEYAARISAKVRSRVVMPPDLRGNPEALYEVTLLPGGDVLQATLRKSSGNSAYDEAVRRAIMAAQPLPVPPDPMLFQEHFRRFILSFRPKE